jgi:hypothetical protein
MKDFIDMAMVLLFLAFCTGILLCIFQESC